MSKNLRIALGLIVILLVAAGAVFFLGNGSLPTALATASPTATIVAVQVEPTATPLPPPPTTTPIPPPSPTATATPLPLSLEPVEMATSLPVTTPAVAQTDLQPQPAAQTVSGETDDRSLSGEWTFNFGTMILAADGVRVAGTYRWYGGLNAGEITGSIMHGTDQFRGIWISQGNPSEQGFLKWPMRDLPVIRGVFDNGDTEGQWCAVRAGQALPAGCGFSGEWLLHFGQGNLEGQATLVQTGDRVRGTYTTANGEQGTIEGTITALSITEAALSGNWQNNNGESGPFEWRIDSTTGRTFAGRRQPGHSEWCGWREGTGRPEQCGF